MSTPDQLGADEPDLITRLCAANIAPAMDAAAVILVIRLIPGHVVEVILSATEAHDLGRELQANSRYLASRDHHMRRARS